MGGFRLVWQDIGRSGPRCGRARAASGLPRWGAERRELADLTVRAALAGDPRRPRPEQRLRMGEVRLRAFRIEAVSEVDPQGRWLTVHRERGVPA